MGKVNELEDLQKLKQNKIDKCTKITGINVDTITDTQINYCDSCTGLPRDNGNGYLITIKYTDTYIVQKFFRRSTRDEYTRFKENGIWTEWVGGIEELNVASLLKNGWKIHSDTGCQIFKQGKIIYIQLCIKDGTSASIMTLPEGYRPNKLMYLPCVSSELNATSYISINSIGNITTANNIIGKLLFINISYKVD